MPRIFGREPALWLALFASLVKLAVAFGLHATIEQQALVNAGAAAFVALVVALIVHAGRGAALIGLLQAALALAVGYGMHLDAERQATLMVAVATVVGMWTRTQVTAPVAEKRALPPVDGTDVYGG